METVKSPAEHKVILHNVSWGTYERLMDERGENRVPRFHHGALEPARELCGHLEVSNREACLGTVQAMAPMFGA